MSASNLIERLEAAEAGSPELSDEVLIALGWIPFVAGSSKFSLDNPDWVRPNHKVYECGRGRPDPTQSFADCEVLRPEGWRVSGAWWDKEKAVFNLTRETMYADSKGKRPELAYSAAIIRAHEQEAGSHE